MWKLLSIGLTAVVLFAASAGVSWYLRHLKETKLEQEPAKASEGEPASTKRAAAQPSNQSRETHGSSAAANPSMSPAVRAPFNPEAEGTVQIATQLKERLASIHLQEEQLSSRQKNLELIFQDIRAERTGIDEKRRQVSNLMKTVEEKMAELDSKVGDLKQQQQQTNKNATELKKNISEYDNLEKDRIKQVAAMYDSMDPGSAAKILQTLAESGNLDTAVKILATMRDRQAAKVLTELGDPGLAAQLVERLKGLKKPADSTSK
jgi:flagellar motility protein MotE (MotC chaperone)